jgi:hypothetical protein
MYKKVSYPKQRSPLVLHIFVLPDLLTLVFTRPGNSLPDFLPERLPRFLPEIVPNSLPESLPETSPELLPEPYPSVLPDTSPESLLEPYLSMVPKISPERLLELYPDTYPIRLTRPYPITFLGQVPFNWPYPKTSTSASHLDLGLFRPIMHHDCSNNPKPTWITLKQPGQPHLTYTRPNLLYPSLPKPQVTRHWPSSVLPIHFSSR